MSNTGRSKHLDACAACSEEVAGAVRREQGGNDSAFGALDGLTTLSLGATVAYSDVTVGALRLTARDWTGLARWSPLERLLLHGVR